MSLRESADARVIASHKGLREQLTQIWTYRGLLYRMVRKELQVKYKNSALGFLWSMLNPALYLAIFYVVFQVVLESGIPTFPIFLLSGLLAWNLFATGLAGATASVVTNASLVGKVYFPREILPLAAVGASVVHFFLQSVVLLLALGIARYDVAWAHMPVVPVALVILVVLVAGLGLFLAAANVYFRDVQHLVELALLAWFWMTPIVYQQQLIADQFDARSLGWVQWLNPLAAVVVVFQRAIYNVVTTVSTGASVRKVGPDEAGEVLRILPEGMDLGWYVTHLGPWALVAVAVAFGGLVFFGRTEGDFAEQI